MVTEIEVRMSRLLTLRSQTWVQQYVGVQEGLGHWESGHNIDLALYQNCPKRFTSKLLVGGLSTSFPHRQLLWSTTWGFFVCVLGSLQGLFYLNKDKDLVQCQCCPSGVQRQPCSNTSGMRPEDVQLQPEAGRRQSAPANQQQGCLSKGTALSVNDDRFILQPASQIMALFHLLSHMLSKHHKPFCAMCFWKS